MKVNIDDQASSELPVDRDAGGPGELVYATSNSVHLIMYCDVHHSKLDEPTTGKRRVSSDV